MEKYFFKYEYGYINIDANNLFLTTTGNWSETQTISEKNTASRTINYNRKNKLYGYYIFIISIMLFMFNFSDLELNNFMKGLFLIGSLLFFAYSIMKKEYGNQYKIPLTKIEKIEFNDKKTIVYFKNGEDNSDWEIIYDLEEKGIVFLKDLCLNKQVI